MIYSDPYFRKGALLGLLLGPAFYAASVIEGEQLVNSASSFVRMAHGAHSVGVTTLLFLGFWEIAESYERTGSSIKNRCLHIGALICLIAGTVFHVFSLVSLYQKGAPLDRHDPELRRYLNFCRLFIFANMSIEYFLYQLAPARPRRDPNLQLIQ